MHTRYLLLLLCLCVPATGDPLVVFFIDPSAYEYWGDAMLVRTPGGRNFVIDGGQRAYGPDWDCGLQRVLPLLDSLDVTYLDGTVGTHPHSDHIGGLISVLDSLPVVTAYDSGWPYESSWTYEEYLRAIENNGSDYVTPRMGDTLDWGPELTVEVFYPREPLPASNANNASIVLRLTYGEVAFLFTGDLETNGGEDVILAQIGDISADVLKVGHHGSATSTCNAWLSAVDPSIAAICVGSGNPFGHPHSEVVSRILGRGITIYRTDLDGTFFLSTDGNEVYFNMMPPTGGGGPSNPETYAVFPSPATSTATFTWDPGHGESASIRVFNLNGELVLDVDATGDGYVWDLSTPGGGLASPGLYAAIFTTSEGGTCTEYFTVSR